MSVVATALRELIALGVSGDALVAAVERIEAAATVERTASLAEAVAMASARADQELTVRQARNARYYAAKRLKASESKTPKTLSDASKTVSDDSDAIKTLSDADASRTHVRDITSNSENNHNLTTPYSASELDWPDTEKPSRAYLDKLEAALREAGGLAIASPAVAPRVASLAAILALGRAGKGPPCDLNADVLPTIRARAARAAPNSVKGWDYFRDAILEARDRRLAGAPAVASIVQLRATGPPRSFDEKSSAAWDEAIKRLAEND